MKTIRFAFVLTLLALTLAGACGKQEDPHKPWYPHHVSTWTWTPGGYARDAGGFASVESGFVTDAEIDSAIDKAFAHFGTVFPNIVLPARPVALNDDYVLWVKQGRGNNQGVWASGLWITGQDHITVALWSRGEGSTPPAVPDPFIAREPGNYWGVHYDTWRWTALPLVPAIEHELLHTAIGDPEHARAEWATLNTNPRMKAAQQRCVSTAVLERF